mmetsp:Transcript_7335/g.18813  ORF Transcript_7335/g.18813 Transcript_7335/m.18813 type:complete len:105 (-) Transcript_7335:1347-1661(-)
MCSNESDPWNKPQEIEQHSLAKKRGHPSTDSLGDSNGYLSPTEQITRRVKRLHTSNEEDIRPPTASNPPNEGIQAAPEYVQVNKFLRELHFFRVKRSCEGKPRE